MQMKTKIFNFILGASLVWTIASVTAIITLIAI